ncbi:MAG: glycerophosphodiester phosphodiesterase [Pelagibacterium sp. SCN 64-44]|nr:MAG: glycerophosphodiester phosphodiesterase [Pelagibacterium sp. SCN 64-44]
MGWRRRTLIGTVLALGAIAAFNAGWRVAPPENAHIGLIAHRGVHQNFERAGLTNDTCTAERIGVPTHGYIENTIASMQAAFAAGADIVELDVHPTTDGQFAVLHDWTLDCRTEGSGETRSHSMAYLRTLDVGYGYTADNGASFPLRGTGIGLMPELKDVLAAMPDRRFLVNFKSREAREGDMLAALVQDHPEWRPAIWGAYGGDEPSYRAAEQIDGLAVWSRRSMVDCLLQYEALGWTGFMPQACRDTMVLLPINAAPFIWGWPHLFVERLRAAGSKLILLGPYEAGDPGTAGIDIPDLLAQVPAGFDGYIWTNRIETIGPALRGR